jgi:hypothetical protein
MPYGERKLVEKRGHFLVRRDTLQEAREYLDVENPPREEPLLEDRAHPLRCPEQLRATLGVCDFSGAFPQ